jgi:hypothetical protein
MNETTRATRGIGRWCLTTILFAPVAACGGPSVTVPPDPAPRAVVLDAYLEHL